MKPLFNIFATKETRKKMVSVGSSTQPAKYTKDDFLTPGQVAKKFGISTDTAKEVMKKLNFERAIFVLNGHKAKIIMRHSDGKSMRLHPMATEAFQKYLDTQKD